MKESGSVKETGRIFPRVESCVFFAVCVIKNLESSVLCHLKSSTLVELRDNVYIKAFAHLFPPSSRILKQEMSKQVKVSNIKHKQK